MAGSLISETQHTSPSSLKEARILEQEYCKGSAMHVGKLARSWPEMPLYG